MIGPGDIGQMVRVADDFGPYANEVAKLADVDAGRTYVSGFIRFEDGTGGWVAARRLTTDETQRPLRRAREES